MKFVLDGTDYDVDLNHINVLEMRQLKEKAGLGVAALALGVVQGDVDALCAAVWLAKNRAGEKLRWSDLDSLDLVSLVHQLGTTQYKIVAVATNSSPTQQVERLRVLADEIEAAEADAEAEAAADPTPAAAAPETTPPES